jgi:hypothetical protein
MSRKTPRSLPSLAHPVIVSLGQRVEKDEGSIPLRRPPFPDIDLNNGQGFTFSHLHWVVIKVTNASLSEEEVRGVELALVHEFCHKCLALTPFSQLRQDEMFKLYSLILTTFEEEQEKIRIPLIRNKPSNKLRKQWELIVRLEEVSKLVEEVFAVRASLTVLPGF